MNIGIDFTPAIYGRGVSRYTVNLVRALLETSNEKITLYGSSLRGYRKLIEAAQSVADTARPENRPEIFFQHWPPSTLSHLWRFGANRLKDMLPLLDVFHSWDWLQPPDKNVRLVSTIHDLALVKYPETAHPNIVKAHQRSWKILKEREAEIIAVSQATKKDIIQLLGIPSFRIHVIPEAVPYELIQSNEALTEDQSQHIKQKLDLSHPYLLFVGTREPRKNLERLIEAWAPLQNEVQLLIVGAAGWDKTGDTLYADLPGLRFLPKTSDQELNILYAEAEALVFPSLDEGFGLPILEAFYHGTPVVTSNVSALVEVAGNAAELVDPLSSDSIRKGIERVLNENTEQQRKRLQRMIIRLHMFSWHQVAHQTLSVYKKAVERHA